MLGFICVQVYAICLIRKDFVMTYKEELLGKITPKNDVIFKKIFGSKGNEGILKSFLESILEIQIESLNVDVGTEMLPDFFDGKNSRLDVKAILNDGTIVNIEVQTNMSGYSDERSLAYWSKLYLEQFKSGNDYKKAAKTICIWILDGEVYDFNEYHSQWFLSEKNNGRTSYFNEIEIHVIELKKFRKENIINPKKKEFWLWFIDYTKKEMVDVSYSLEEIRKAKAEYEKMIEGNEAIQHLLLREELAEWDRNSMRAEARREGLAEGKREGLEEGKREGLEKGMEEGRKEGEREAKLETARKLLDKGIDIEIIADVTGLSVEELEELKRK